MEIQGSKKNHIQIPKSILESFSDKTNGYKVCRLNCKGKIDFELPKNCNILENYYSENVETNILASIESDFGQVKNKIVKCIKQSSPINLTPKEFDSIKWFFIISLARQPQIANNLKIDEDSLWYFDGKTPRDAFIEFADLMKRNLFKDLYPNCGFCISVNHTNQNFIVPQNCVYHTFNEINQIAALPISPKLLIALVQFDKGVPQDVFPIIEVKDLKLVDAFNIAAISAEMNTRKANKYKYLYSQKESDFVRYDILEQLRKGKK